MLFFFNDPAPTEIYTLSLHDALPIFLRAFERVPQVRDVVHGPLELANDHGEDRKSTRLNSSHANISYAVFCLKKKKTLPAIRWSSRHELTNRCEQAGNIRDRPVRRTA